MLVILVNTVVDPKRVIRKKRRAEEEERHEGSLTKKRLSCKSYIYNVKLPTSKCRIP
jgi:hypothetical protein